MKKLLLALAALCGAISLAYADPARLPSPVMETATVNSFVHKNCVGYQQGHGSDAATCATSIPATDLSGTLTSDHGGIIGTQYCLTNQPCVYISPSATPTTDSAAVTFQNSTRTSRSFYGGVVPSSFYQYATVRAVLDMQPGSAVQGGSAFEAYLYMAVPSGATPVENNGVGLSVHGIAAVDGAAMWGLNPSLIDSTDGTTARSHPTTMVGGEFDFNVWNAGSRAEGLSLIMTGGAQPVGANAFQVGARGVGKWLNGVVFDNNSISSSTNHALVIGANDATGTPNTGSYDIAFQVYDAAGAPHPLKMFARPSGAKSMLRIQDTRLANWINIVMAPSGDRPYLQVDGDDDHINFDLVPKAAAVRVWGGFQIISDSWTTPGIVLVNDQGQFLHTSAGVACSGPPTSLYTTNNYGIVTHC